MAIVVESVSRKGRVLHSRYFANNTISIGRSYDNDYVLDDHYVDAHHLHVSTTECGDYLCADNASVNGIASAKRRPLVSPHTITADGGTILIGKTLLRIASKRTVTAPAIKLSFIESVGEYLASIPFVIISLLLTLVLATMDVRLSTYDVEEEAYAAVFYVVIGALVLSLIFALLGRALRHDNRFLLYFSLINCVFILSYIYDLISPIIFFNVNVLSSDSGIDEMIYALIFSGFLYFAFRFSTRLRNKGLFLIASLIPTLILVDLLIPDTELEYFNYSPPYDALVRHESVYWRKKQNHGQYLESVNDLYKVQAE